MRLKENEIIEQFQREIDRYAPLTIKSLEQEVPPLLGLYADALIEFRIADGPSFQAVAEVKSVATPKIISQTAQQIAAIISRTSDKTTVPIVIVPYMGKQQAKILQREGVSWIDLCGNMLIRISNKIYIERTGKKNTFPDTAPIKKIFEGISSLVSRALLLNKGSFRSLYEVVDFIIERGGNITLSTVSKVLRSLEEELLVTKTEAGVFVTNREKLLENLVEGYVSYTKRNKNKTYTFDIDESQINILYFSEVDFVLCGFYAAKLKGLVTTDRITIYVKSVNEVRKVFERSRVKFNPNTEFGQLDLIEPKNPCVWFNLQEKLDRNIVDDIELYLELMVDTPRGPKIAEALKEQILRGQSNG
ncbi:MAG: type IV toxin-antitoxin system AbiEi family antitoxin [Planctomycetota bacterium]